MNCWDTLRFDNHVFGGLLIKHSRKRKAMYLTNANTTINTTHYKKNDKTTKNKSRIRIQILWGKLLENSRFRLGTTENYHRCDHIIF